MRTKETNIDPSELERLSMALIERTKEIEDKEKLLSRQKREMKKKEEKLKEMEEEEMKRIKDKEESLKKTAERLRIQRLRLKETEEKNKVKAESTKQKMVEVGCTILQKEPNQEKVGDTKAPCIENKVKKIYMGKRKYQYTVRQKSNYFVA